MIILRGLKTIDDLATKLVSDKVGNKLVAVVFSTSTCAPCKVLKAAISNDLEKKYVDKVSFYVVGFEDNGDLLEEPEFNNIRAVPTVRFMRIVTVDGKKVLQISEEEVRGSNTNALCKTIDELLQ